MTIKVTKPSINLREKLNELEQDTGLKGQELMRADTVAEARSLIGAGRKNLLINGGFDVWQRGTSFSANGYNSDRWYMATNGTMSVAKTWSSDLSMYYFDASNTVTWGVYQKVEDKNCNHLKTGDTITISFWSNTAMSIQFGVSSIATAVYSTSVIDTIGSWSRRSVAITMTSTLINGIQAGNPMYVEVKPNATGSFGFTGVQLELGSVATDFEHRSYGEELALCQRYYQKHSLAQRYIFYYTSPWSSSNGVIDLPVEMRIAPTIAYGFTAVTNAQPGGGGTSNIAPNGGTPHTNYVRLAMNNWPGYQNWATNTVSGGNAENAVYLDAEL